MSKTYEVRLCGLTSFNWSDILHRSFSHERFSEYGLRNQTRQRQAVALTIKSKLNTTPSAWTSVHGWLQSNALYRGATRCSRAVTSFFHCETIPGALESQFRLEMPVQQPYRGANHVLSHTRRSD